MKQYNIFSFLESILTRCWRLCMCLQGGRVWVGTRFSVSVSICLEYQWPLYTSDCSAPRSRVMKEKIGSRESEVSFGGFSPTAPVWAWKLSASPCLLVANAVIHDIRHYTNGINSTLLVSPHVGTIVTFWLDFVPLSLSYNKRSTLSHLIWMTRESSTALVATFLKWTRWYTVKSKVGLRQHTEPALAHSCSSCSLGESQLSLGMGRQSVIFYRVGIGAGSAVLVSLCAGRGPGAHL